MNDIIKYSIGYLLVTLGVLSMLTLVGLLIGWVAGLVL